MAFARREGEARLHHYDDVPAPIVVYTLSAHAADEMRRRSIALAEVAAVMEHPEQRYSVREGREVLQSRAIMESRLYLIRVIVDVDRWPPEIVTVYRTSRIARYWRAHEDQV